MKAMDDAPLYVGVRGYLPSTWTTEDTYGRAHGPAIADGHAATAILAPVRISSGATEVASCAPELPTALRDLRAAAPAVEPAAPCTLPIRISDLRGRPAPLRLAELRGDDPQPEASRAVAA